MDRRPPPSNDPEPNLLNLVSHDDSYAAIGAGELEIDSPPAPVIVARKSRPSPQTDVDSEIINMLNAVLNCINNIFRSSF